MDITDVTARRAKLVDEESDLIGKIKELEDAIEIHGTSLLITRARLEEIEFALKKMTVGTAPVEQAPPPRKRLNIAAAVADFLEAAGSPHTIEELAAGIDRKPSQVSAAAMRLSAAGTIELVPGSSDRYRLVNREAAEAAAAE